MQSTMAANNIRLDDDTIASQGGSLIFFNIIFFAIVVASLGAFVVIDWHNEKENHETARQQLQQMLKTGQMMVFNKLEGFAHMLTLNESLKLAFRQQDRKGLLKMVQPTYFNLRAKHNITHVYFFGKQMETFLRVHQPDRYDDIVLRKVNSKALATMQTSQGIELGPLGTFTLRVVVPWYENNGTLLGFIELGVEFGKILRDMKINPLFKELYLFLDKSLLRPDEWQRGLNMVGLPVGEWDRFTNWILVGGTALKLPVDLDGNLSSDVPSLLARLGRMIFATEHFYNLSVQVADDEGRSVASILAVTDDLAIRNTAQRYLLVWLFGICSFSVLLFVLYLRIASKTEESVEK
ncbi:MAG: hypothetical protein HQM03_07750 [Magnetococcales bacterium]|nr:hypothetical protein [Magnetococcales bacterium]